MDYEVTDGRLIVLNTKLRELYLRDTAVTDLSAVVSDCLIYY